MLGTSRTSFAAEHQNFYIFDQKYLPVFGVSNSIQVRYTRRKVGLGYFFLIEIFAVFFYPFWDFFWIFWVFWVLLDFLDFFGFFIFWVFWVLLGFLDFFGFFIFWVFWVLLGFLDFLGFSKIEFAFRPLFSPLCGGLYFFICSGFS